MNKKLWLIKITFIWGIIADAVETVRMMFPGFYLKSGNWNLIPSLEFSFGLSSAVPLMLGWTLVLAWGLVKPVERRGLLLCLVPVVAGYMFIYISAITNGLLNAGSAFPVLFSQTILIVLSVTSYFFARQISQSSREK